MLGWQVRHSTPDIALLSVGSTLGLRGELLLQRRQHTLLLVCFI
ncbi:hypothetical protein [Streptomyces sp. GS7]|nr:hypothetical protein [Streptomyces sp. GS7]